ncbi:MAG: Transporter, CPA2 family [Candidatus Magasanikbacteria bacterium GW2011_GWD2_43_18]|uniref:Transporter, CPA2 family n=1 Tax=Candidatus Magasanikbacteria bacterium GW2011_GWE2_42_7 TaxID=1619052 RepID=A0A0G1BEI1_9BACT|nr:MAG: Transporter, CPA2 family [Candidatus Magasanikbacteria bacterium GW2011_GWC2_42_27]KKS71785.1 MAG: Transporter, CPA2 family [Candidatus Magasanikbacteria bacterium GW2011_GWE2_42_7]KKT04204.1 MAG: Transporter, CPA2 family [Candidatus Magasanikbacteria bacterium GW2011_GWD2_43_18]KKT25898.1 MAG: Transporter, CPA2 family [Candidatus Magasanikbacteria bacterium GW2011_GWA2_43_9]
MEANIFLQLAGLFGLTVTIAFVMRLLRQPLMIAYIISGMIAGPLFLNAIEHGGGTFDTLAQFGVIFLLFLVGLSLNIAHIRHIGKVSAITGLAQVLFTSTIGFFILRGLGLEIVPSVYMALALTFSSTIIIVKLLSDKKDTETVYGRHVLGLMVVQDIVAVLIMLFLTTQASDIALSEALALIAVKALAIIGLIVVLTKFVLPSILDQVASSSEFLFIFTIAWCFGIASLLLWAGFSLEIGAIIAGISLGSSPYQSEISSRIKPLRDFFIVLFFIILGSEMSIGNAGTLLVPGLILSLFILLGNPFILYLTFRLLKFTRRNSFLAGVTAAQVSEFGFILIFTGVGLGHLTNGELPLFTIVALVTIFVSSYAITYNEQLYKFFRPIFNIFGADKLRQKEQASEIYDVWVVGYHRIGWKICETLAAEKKSFAVVDYNPKAIAKLKQRAIPAFFGDIADVEFLESLPFEQAKIIILTIPEADDQLTLIKHVRAKSESVHIVANLYHKNHLDELYQAGANYVMMPHLLGGQWMSEVLQHSPWTKKTFVELKKEQREEMRLRFTRADGEI